MNNKMKRILVVDDEGELAELVAEQLQDAGFDAFYCNSVDSARKLMLEKKYDVIITDIQMPIETGIDFAESIRKLNDVVPIIFVSGFTNHVKERLSNITRSSILDKPVDIDELVVSVNELLSAS